MRIGTGGNTYDWMDAWARIPDTESGRSNGRTHGVAVTRSGSVVVFHQADPAVLIFDRNGKLASSWGNRFSGAHGLTLVEDQHGSECLWLTDQDSAEVVKTTLDGRTLMRIERPPHRAYAAGKYSPTWAVEDEIRHGGSGEIWVADGYGSGLVHRFDARGRYLATLDGEGNGAGRFNCPHGLWIDRRGGEPMLYIADRANKRFQVFDLEGQFRRVVDSGALELPCGCIAAGEQLVVPELNARITVLDRQDNLVCYLGRNEASCSRPGWPDFPPEKLSVGKFNSPHAAAVDAEGNLYVVEWIIGGRITKLERV